MFSRKVYFYILSQVILILAVMGAGGVLIATGRGYVLGMLLFGAALGLIGVLVGYLNASNRRILRFMEALQDNESTVFFPEDGKNEIQRKLSAAFNQVNDRVAAIKRESRRQEYFYLALLEHVPDGIIAWDSSGGVRIVNDAALRLLGCSPFRYIRQVEPFIPDLDRLVKETEAAGSVLLKVRTRQHIRQLSVSHKRIVQKGESLSILTLKDIGRELSEKESESWEKLTHVLTHEIMNSIAPIASLSCTLLSYYEAKGEALRQEEVTDLTIRRTIRGLKTIKSQSRNLIRFTDSYRRLSYLQPPALQWFDLVPLVEDVCLLLQVDRPKQQVSVETSFSPHPMRVEADKELLSQVMLNLVKNAMQALEEIKGGRIRIEALQTNSSIRIDVTDNGPGIAKEIMEDIFVPFFTTKSTGCGIGLSLSRQIIRMHGGELRVASDPFTETRFTIILPRRTEEHAVVTDPAVN